jgi:hypothetical protein
MGQQRGHLHPERCGDLAERLKRRCLLDALFELAHEVDRDARALGQRELGQLALCAELPDPPADRR